MPGSFSSSPNFGQKMSPHTTAATTIRNQQYYEEPGGEKYGNVLLDIVHIERILSACEEFL